MSATIEITIPPIGSVADHMAEVRAYELSLLEVGVVSPMTMPARRPKHVWSPPARGRRLGEAYVTVRPEPAPDNAHIRRVRRRNGTAWHA